MAAERACRARSAAAPRRDSSRWRSRLLLLPLRAVFPMTYRGQHLYPSASGAAFSASRAIEVLLRFGGIRTARRRR
jgi:hypothetical protein